MPCCGPALRISTEPVRMRGQSGEVVDVIRYVNKLCYDRKVYRLSRHRVFIGEYETPEELGKAVDLAELVEDEPGQPRPRRASSSRAGPRVSSASQSWNVGLVIR